MTNKELSKIGKMLSDTEKSKLKEFDIIFLIDATSSMSPYIEAAKSTAVDLSKSLRQKFPETNFQYGYIFYRDPIDSVTDTHEIINLTDNVNSLPEKIGQIRACGGADLPEDWAGAYKKLNEEIEWRNGTKIIFHLADAGAHGKLFTPYDKYPDEEQKLIQEIEICCEKKIKIFGFVIEEDARNSFEKCKDIYRNKGGFYEILNFEKPKSRPLFDTNYCWGTGGSLFGSSATLFASDDKKTSDGGLFGKSTGKSDKNTNNSGGGLFGNTKNSSGSLFGYNNTNTNNSSGGLFGYNNTNTNNSSGSLFGNKKNSSNGLFGKNDKNDNTSSSGLFGKIDNNTNKSRGGLFANCNENDNNSGNGLFGKSDKNDNNSSRGLFGKSDNNTNNSSGGLFGNTNNSNGGLFGNNHQNDNISGGGLFGNSNENNNNSSGSLFGNNNNENNSGSNSLFGNKNENNNNSNNLFANSSENNNQGEMSYQSRINKSFFNLVFDSIQNVNKSDNIFLNNNTNK